MNIDPNKQYRTRDGRAVRIYATDGGGRNPVHGAFWSQTMRRWIPSMWDKFGSHDETAFNNAHPDDLVEVTLADELRDQIPWEVLRPEIQWVAMTPEAQWEGFSNAPWPTDLGWCFKPGRVWRIDALNMPNVDRAHWEQTLTQRPEGR